MTAVCIPNGLKEGDIVRTLRERYQVGIGGSTAGEAKGKLFRISHQGVQASAEMLIPTLAALEQTLSQLGYPVRPATAVEAFLQALNQDG